MIKVGILFSDIDYAEKLAYRLCEIYPGLQIKVGETDPNSKWDILLADRPQRPDDLLQTACFVELTREEYFLPASAVLNKMLDACQGCSGRIPFRTTGDPGQILTFSSLTGGAGTTAAAVMLGRVLAGASDKDVLYLSADTGVSEQKPEAGWRAYTKITEPARRPAAELAYRLLRPQNVRLPSYLAKDFYGLHYLSLHRDGVQKLLQHPELTAGYRTVIVDCGTWADHRLPGVRFQLADHSDSRSGLFRPQRDKDTDDAIPDDTVLLENRGHRYQQEDRTFTLTNDPGSFTLREERDGTFVEIASDGIFAHDIRRMARALLFLPL